MEWQQKLQAVTAICDVSLKMRKPNDWYVDAGLEVGGDGMLRSCYGNGVSPEEAVNDQWSQVINIPSDRYLVVKKFGKLIRVRWNGFMWEDCQHLHDKLISQGVAV